MLYLSLYFKQQRARYYELLDAVRRDGEWEEWVAFFAEGAADTAQGAVSTARKLADVAGRDRDKIAGLGRRAGSAAVIHHTLQRMPVCTIPRLAKRTKLTLPTVAKALDILVELRIAREITGKKRHRVYSYDAYMKILNEGTDPL